MKVRPAVVVQCDRDNARMSNTIAVQVTSNLSRAHEPTQYLIDSTHRDWLGSGLRRPSVIKLLLTLPAISSAFAWPGFSSGRACGRWRSGWH